MVEEGLVSIVVGAIVAALFFDFVNGFHDSANAIATVVGCRLNHSKLCYLVEDKEIKREGKQPSIS